MAARPNALRTLEYGHRLAKNQITRLSDMIKMAETVLVENKTLTPAEIAGYKDCIRAAKKQSTLFTNVGNIALPTVDLSTKRKDTVPVVAVSTATPATNTKRRGRPPKTAAVVAAPVENTPKRRGRPPKAVSTAPISAEPPPKRRGRPPKVAVISAEVSAETPALSVPKRRGRPPKNASASTETVAAVVAVPKKRGRKPKLEVIATAPVDVTCSEETNGVELSDFVEAAPKRGPGRPKGSKNKPVSNGQNGDLHDDAA